MHTLSLKCLLPWRRCPIAFRDANFSRARIRAHVQCNTHNIRTSIPRFSRVYATSTRVLANEKRLVYNRDTTEVFFLIRRFFHTHTPRLHRALGLFGIPSRFFTILMQSHYSEESHRFPAKETRAFCRFFPPSFSPPLRSFSLNNNADYLFFRYLLEKTRFARLAFFFFFFFFTLPTVTFLFSY